MMLLWLILVPMIAGILAWILGRDKPLFARWVSLVAMAVDLVLAIVLWTGSAKDPSITTQGNWLMEYVVEWVPQLGISFHLAIDGISLLMILLTAFLGIVSVMASWSEITKRVAFFHFNLMWILAGVIGVFLAMDLFLFYFFWEIMLVPMYFLIAIWGHERRLYAAVKFFIFTQASGLLMLLAILGLYFGHHALTGVYSYNYFDLLQTAHLLGGAKWLMLGFFVAFAVKIPAFPFHPWLADAHTEAPTAGSVILAGLLLKTGAYGMLRFVIPLFPDAAAAIAPLAMLLGVIGIIYGAILAFAQHDVKRLVAYTSVSHLGFVLLGIFAFNELALQGAVMQMICHGLSTGALFIIAGRIQEEIHTRDMRQMGAFWKNLPRMGGVAMFFAIASLGLPGLGNFVGEFLALVGAFRADATLSILAAAGLVAATIYSLWIIQQVFHGREEKKWNVPDLNLRYMVMFAAMMIALVWLGLYPQPVLDTSQPAVMSIQQSVEGTASADAADALSSPLQAHATDEDKGGRQ